MSGVKVLTPPRYNRDRCSGKGFPETRPGEAGSGCVRETAVRLLCRFLMVVSLCAAALMVVPAGPEAFAAPSPATFGPNDPRITFEGHWAKDDDLAITVNSGSSL